jgi:hypothetical protein
MFKVTRAYLILKQFERNFCMLDVLACLKLLRQALEYGKKKEMIHFHLGLCLEEMGQYSKAAEEFQFVIQKNPRNALVFFRMTQSIGIFP